MKNRFYILLVVFTVFQTKSYSQENYKWYLEPLNVKAFKKSIFDLSTKKDVKDFKDPKSTFNERFTLKTDSVLINADVFLTQNNSIQDTTYEYSETNEKTKNKYNLHSYVNGYKKTIILYNNPVIVNISYTPNGIVSSVEQVYGRHSLDSGELSYPVSKAYFLLRNTKLIVDYDNTFKFTLKDVYKLLRSNHAQIHPNTSIIAKSGFDIHNDFILLWEIQYFSTKYGKCDLLIDAISKKILHDDKNIHISE